MDVRNEILNAKLYDGKKAPKKLSASQISKDTLELYLDALYDAQPRRGWSKGEIGSIFHLGMEKFFENHPDVVSKECIQEKRFSKNIGDWTIDGKIDMVDTKKKIIIDWKGMSASAYSVFKKNVTDHKINMQMAIYNWLLGGGYSCEAHIFITDFDPVNGTHPASAYQILKCNVLSINQVRDYIEDKISDIEKYISTSNVPPKCNDVMVRYVKETKGYVNAKCEYYCDYAHKCPHKAKASAAKIGLDWGR